MSRKYDLIIFDCTWAEFLAQTCRLSQVYEAPLGVTVHKPRHSQMGAGEAALRARLLPS